MPLITNNESLQKSHRRYSAPTRNQVLAEIEKMVEFRLWRSIINRRMPHPFFPPTKVIIVTVTHIPIDHTLRKELEQEAAELTKDHVVSDLIILIIIMMITMKRLRRMRKFGFVDQFCV